MRSATQLTVIKVGGSLHDEPRLFERIESLCEALAPDRILIVSGGGAAADAVRAWDRVFGISEIASHSLAIHAMGLGARLLAHGVAGSNLVSSVADSHETWQATRIAIADPQPIIDELSTASGSPLPTTWDCTADAISAWIARRMNAQRLVLCKSISLSEVRTTANAIDKCISEMSNLPELIWCNLRDESPSLLRFELPFELPFHEPRQS